MIDTLPTLTVYTVRLHAHGDTQHLHIVVCMLQYMTQKLLFIFFSLFLQTSIAGDSDQHALHCIA